jgi:phosphonate transport system substrate-binding protein
MFIDFSSSFDRLDSAFGYLSEWPNSNSSRKGIMNPTAPTAPHYPFSIGRVSLFLLPLVTAVLLVAGWIYLETLRDLNASETQAQARIREIFGVDQRTPPLDARFVDTDGDLVADGLANPQDMLTPDELTFSYIGSSDNDELQAAWTEFLAHLSMRLDRPVKYQVYRTVDQQLAALAAGELHVTAVNTGSVPRAVNQAGFIPAFTFGREDGTFGYTSDLIVPADSPLQSPTDLKARRFKITFAGLRSHSGFQVPVQYLSAELDLLPQRDYLWGFSQGHGDSIVRVARGELELAAVASDMIDRTLAEHSDISANGLRVIHRSQTFPPAALGYSAVLDQDTAKVIRDAFETFVWEGTQLAEQYGQDGSVKFVPVNYAQDWASVRAWNEKPLSP